MNNINEKIDKNFRKNFLWNTIGISVYALSSLIFMIIATRINGIEDAGIFTFAFSFACMMQVIAFYAGRTFQVTERDKKITDSDFLKFKIFCCLMMIVAGLIFCLLRNYDSYKFIIIFILLAYKCLDAFSEAIYGIFQRNNNLFQCGISFFLKGLICPLIFLVVDIFTKNLMLSVMSILISDVLIFILYDIIKLSKYKIKVSKFTKNNFKFLLLGGISIFIFSFLIQYVINAQKYVIDFMGSNSEQTIFGVILMPATFMAICAQFIINPFLYNINKTIKNKNFHQFKKHIFKIVIYVLLIGILVTIICWICGIPILNFIYNLNLNEYLYPLLLIVIGSTFYAIVSVLSNALIAIRKNIKQTIAYCIASLFSFIASYLMFENFQILGASFAFFTTMLLLLILYVIIYVYDTRKFFKGIN